jgi:hypothetical protein
MTDTTIYQYRLYCIEEATFVYTWSAEVPTLCPNNHLDRTIDSVQTLIVGKVGTNIVTAQQDTLKNFQHIPFPINVPTMSTGGVYDYDFSFPMDVQIWKCEFYTTSDHIGDFLTIYLAPNTVVGVLTSSASIGNTTINVSPTAVTNQLISNGVDFSLDDGVNINNCGRIISYDTTLNTITFETPLTNNFAIGTMIKFQLKAVNNLLLHRPNKVHKVGERGFRGRLIPKNTVLRASYTNMNGLAKQFVVVIEIYYQ